MDKSRPNGDTIPPASKLSVYLQQLSGQVDMIHSIDLDHTYALPNSWKSENTYAKPAKTLFVSKKPSVFSSGIIDVDNCEEDWRKPKPAYDEIKAKNNMNETERLLSSTVFNHEDCNQDWESKLNRTQWTLAQSKLFDRALRILNHDRLARLTHQGSWNEPVLRKVSIDKSARRFRTLLSTFGWRGPLLHWLHNTFIDFLDLPYLISYIDVLQALKKKVPALIERLLSSVNFNSRIPPELLNRLLKKAVDPASFGLNCYSPRRLPGNPLILIIPSAPGTNTLQNARVQRWFHSLSMIGHATLVSTNNLLYTKAPMMTVLDHMLAATRAKLAELRSDHAGRTIILVGFNTGAALACQVALLEQVTAVICIGFPLNTVEDKRGRPDDNILNLKVPVLFVTGQHAMCANIDDLEDLRERLRVQSGLIVVGSADEQMRVVKSKLIQEGITQFMVDRCIVDEIADFVGTILLSPPSATAKISNAAKEGKAKMKFVEKKKRSSVNDDAVQPKKNQITFNPIKRGAGRPATRGGLRMKWSRGGEPSIRKTSLPKEALMSSSHQSMDTIDITDLDRILVDDSDGETYKILPHIRVGGDDATSRLTEDDLMEQLTPDRLLEMPVIIAQEDSPETPSSKLIVNRGNRVTRLPGTLKRLPSKSPVKILIDDSSETEPQAKIKSLNLLGEENPSQLLSSNRNRFRPF